MNGRPTVAGVLVERDRAYKYNLDGYKVNGNKLPALACHLFKLWKPIERR